MAAEREDLRGRTVGEFVLRERIGRGGFGAVYRCEQPLLGREAVVKVLHRKLRHNDVVVQRFLREAQLASRLDHPYAAHVYAFGIEHADGLFWIAMERVQGTTLDRWLRDRGPLPLDRFVPFFERVAEVVQTAHERGIVHRDLKPSNVMVIERAGRLLPKLLDFGVAKLLVDAIVPHWAPMPCESDASTTVDTLDAAEPSGEWLSSSGGTEDGSATPPSARTPQPLTGANTTLGSPPYMSPEQWSDPGTVGPASDLYALGVMAYEALTGRRPFMAASVAELVELHCHAAVPPLGPELPPALDRVVQRALAKRPEDRWGSALELAGALRAASGLATGWTDLPRLDEAVRDAWLGDAPQPLAESVAALDGARNAHQACDATDELVRNLVRYLLAVALATCAQVREDRADPEVLDRVRAMRRGDLAVPERIELLRALVRPLIGRRGAHPVPELVDLVTPHADGSDELDPILALQPLADRAGADDIHRTRLVRFMPELTQLLRRATFVLDHGLVVPRNQAAEQWSGLRRRHRGLATVVGGELVDGHPMLLGGDGRICIDLWPLVQAVAPTEGAELELFLFDGRGRHGARLVAAPAGFEHHDPGVWEWIAARILGETAAEPVTGSDDQPPYLGLTPFATADAARFVGREAEVDAFLNRLRQKSLQVVFGPSGAGKSSFVHAGVIPGLPPGWRTVTMRPGGAPLTTLAARLAAANLATGDVRAALETSPASVVAQVFQASQGGTTVFVIDQLEELFTLCGSAERLQFATVIAQLVASVDAPVAPVASIAPGSPGSSGSSGSSIRVICTIRDDFLVQLDALAPLRPLLSPALVLLGNPSREALVRIIVEPARRAGYALSDPELAQDMVSAVADRPGALALVSFTASQLWELRDRQIRQLTRTAYEAMGGVGGALGRHAEATLDMLSADEQKLAREIFRHLVTADGTRARATVAELEHRLGPPPVQAMIDKLVATRLVTLTGPEGEPSVELMQRLAREVFRHMVIADGTRARATVAELEHRLAAPRVQVVIDKLVAARLVTLADSEDTPSVELIHEALIATWPRLQQWVREDVEGARLRDQIRVASRHWQDRDRPRGLLWGEDVLAELERWLRRSVSVTLSELETAFVAASRKVAHRARRLRRLLRLAALGVVGIVLLGATQYRSAAKISVANQLAEQRLTQSYVEQGRLALLEGQYTEATAYFGYVQKRGGDSPAVQFMLAQATQPLLAEIWRLNSASGRMWIGAFSRDGRRIVTTDDQGARVWEARSGKLQYTLPHADAVFDAVFSSGSETLITAGGDGFVKVWDMSTGSLVRAWTRDRPDGGHTRYYRVAMTPDGRLVAALDYRGDLVEVWDEHTGELAAELSDEAASSGSALAFSADGRWLASSGRGETTRVFDTRTWKLAVTLPARQVNCLKFDPTGPRLATGSMLGDASLWDIPSGQRIRHLHEMGEKVNDVAFSPDGAYVVTASSDGAERVWNARTGTLKVELKNHRAAVASVEFDPSSRLVVSAGKDGIVVVSDVLTGLPVAVLEGAHNDLTVARFDPSSTRVLGVAKNGTAQVWNVSSQYLRWSSPAIDPDCGTDTTQDEDRRFLAVGCTQHGTHVWDTASGQMLTELPSVTEPGGVFYPGSPVVSEAGDLVAVALDDTVVVYRLPGGEVVRRIKHPAKVNAVAFARHGHDLASASIDGSLRVTRDGREPLALPAFAGGIAVIGFAEDGRLIAAGLQGKLRMYDPVLATVSSESDLPIPARSFRMSSDGHRMIVIPTNVKPRPPVLWDLDRDRVIAQLEGSKVQVFSARFIRGDREILTAGGDGVARRWDGETGRLLQSYRGSPKFLLDAVLAPDGSTVVTGGGDGMLRFWDTASGALLWALQAHRSAVAGIHFEGAELVSRGFTGEISRWALPKLAGTSRIEELVRCLPLRFSETTGGLVDQAPCDAPPAGFN